MDDLVVATGNINMNVKVSIDPLWEHMHYTSTACIHKDHDSCRLTCKYCAETCRCNCHEEETDD